MLEYLRFLPLCTTGLADLKVHPLNALCTAHYLYPAQVWLEIVEDTVRKLQEGLEPGVMRHVLWQVGQQNCHIKADVLEKKPRLWSLNEASIHQQFREQLNSVNGCDAWNSYRCPQCMGKKLHKAASETETSLSTCNSQPQLHRHLHQIHIPFLLLLRCLQAYVYCVYTIVLIRF